MKSPECESKVVKEYTSKIEVSMSQHRYAKRTPLTEEAWVYTCVHNCIPTCTQQYTRVYTTSL